MQLLAIIFFYLALRLSSTFAKIPVPEGYRIISVTDLGKEKTNESKDNPHAPLLNATLSCYKENHATLLWRNYDLWGTGWYGVSEKSIKFAAANANACITRWKFETWNTTLCHDNADGSEECEENLPVWHATVSSLPRSPGLTVIHQMLEHRLCKVLILTGLQFRHSQTMSGSFMLTDNFEKLTGLYSRR